MFKELDEVGSCTANDVEQVSSLSTAVNNLFPDSSTHTLSDSKQTWPLVS